MANKEAKRPKQGASRAKDRPAKRIPVSGNRNIMTVQDKDPNFVYRWVNDVENRVQVFERGGWKLVEDSHQIGDRTAESSKGVSKAISKYVGMNRTSYLMRIEKEYYTEDQAAKAAKLTEQETAMLAGEKSSEGRYGHMSIK